MCRRALLTPVGWLWIAASICSLPLLETLTPKGLFGHNDDRLGLIYQVAFLSELGGSMLAMGSLKESDWLLAQCSAPRRLLSQWTGLTVTALAGAAMVLAASFWWGGFAALDQPALLALGLGALHLAALGAILLQLPMGIGSKALSLPLIAWIIPSLLSTKVPATALLITLLNPHRELSRLTDPGVTEALSSLAPILALGMASILITSGGPPHRVHPR